ncbi:autotransporter assembly complex family protein [Erythrobacter sp. THAF29]|uniref:autotransporter assembly complex protein TamA n=1 Tax=Erythrobacter sp. THAF29 TaxID=2587851 RepID=UPI0012A7D276|nr:BamA/TamA family outer membrane protein [Erythrobacter sp. THAF29]QFT77040.1 Translocation and assembly module TamA precursor [Erythrobacter sp. THAF29]
MQRLQFNLALAAGLCAASAFVPAGAFAHSQAQEADEQPATPPPTPEEDEQDASPPPSRTLDELIPEGVVDNAEDWATQGVTNPAAPLPDAEAVGDAAQTDLMQPVDPAFTATFDDLGIPEPQRLEPDPEVQAIAEIDAPDLVELPELEEFRVSDELILAFPADNDRFPERTNFIDRFRALSTIEDLDSDDDTIPQLAARARADEELLVQMLRTYGYYSGEVARQLSGGRRGDNGDIAASDTDPQVRFDILPGERYRFAEIDLGRLDTAPDYEALRAAFEIQPGDPLQSDRIIAEEADLRIALGETGYPFAEIDAPSLLIDHARQEGDLSLPVEPGGKYVFAGVTSEDPRFLSDRHLERIARFDEGDVYQASLQADLRRAILATGLVSSAVVTPREITPPSEGQPGEVELDVEFERAPLRTIAGAIGYGTEDGLKVEASWEHRNLFPPEGSLKLRGIVGTREQLASVTYKRNNFLDRDQVLTIDAYASDIETEAVDARTVALRGSFERISNLLFQKPFSWQIGAEALYTDERNRVISGIPRERQTYRILGLFGRATIDASDDLLDPTTGYRVTGFLAPEVSSSIGTETFYVRAQADASYYMPVGSTVLAGRVRAATIQGAQAFQIAPSRRLYAGGGGSVRGYGFQAIGPRNDLGEPTGGGSLVEVSLEARIQTGLLDGAVEVVPFIDAGSVSLGSTPDFRFIQYGAGVGIRYKTSFGPIRVDVGTPLNPTEFDAPVVVYVSLGQAF